MPSLNGRRLGIISKPAKDDLASQERAGSLRAEVSCPGDMEGQVIAWRPAVRVRVATNIPPSLLHLAGNQESSASLTPFGLSNSLASLSSAGFRDKKESLRQPRWQSVTRSLPAMPPRSLPPPSHPPSSRHHYGAWYLPIQSWKDMSTNQQGGWNDRGLSDPPNTHPEFTKRNLLRFKIKLSKRQLDEELRQEELQRLQSKVDSQLANLYSGKMYKEYIQKHGQRVPHYLEKVEGHSSV